MFVKPKDRVLVMDVACSHSAIIFYGGQYGCLHTAVGAQWFFQLWSQDVARYSSCWSSPREALNHTLTYLHGIICREYGAYFLALCRFFHDVNEVFARLLAAVRLMMLALFLLAKYGVGGRYSKKKVLLTLLEINRAFPQGKITYYTPLSKK